MNINILILSLIFFLSFSIMLFDLDFRKAKKIEGKLKNEIISFKWVGYIYLICIVSWIILLFINWKVAVLGVVVYYASTSIPLPQTIGRFLVGLFNRGKKNKKI